MLGTIRMISGTRGALQRGATACLVALVFTMVGITLMQVILRYGFNAPLRWSEELARYIFVWISFLGLYLAYRKGAHLGLDMLPYMVGPSVGKVLELSSQTIILITLIWAVGTSGRLVSISLNQGSAVMGLPMIYVYSAFLVGAILVIVDIFLGWLEEALKVRVGGQA
ncbi:TRAP transporter small permease [uncultured Jannaschia sp.]|uniref:TRAP transporter small permease n=1 Tax=uncultured Jannaschia sp. TaxID=293347 RepID=UPI002620882B|nr:TRAP transporter small permease [uncultured Jannaschia sp.]